MGNLTSQLWEHTHHLRSMTNLCNTCDFIGLSAAQGHSGYRLGLRVVAATTWVFVILSTQIEKQMLRRAILIEVHKDVKGPELS